MADDSSPEFVVPPIDVANRPVLVPCDAISADALRDLARESLLRQMGSDDPGSGNLEAQTDALLDSLRRGFHVVTFDPVTESAGILRRQDLPRETDSVYE